MKYGYSTAVGLFQNVIAFLMLVAVNRLAGRVNEYGLW
jgi:putative aldouronate transport system permease protein